MKSITETLLGLVSDWKGAFPGAFNIREDGECAGRRSTKNIEITSKTDVPGLDIRIRPGTRGGNRLYPSLRDPWGCG